MKRFLFAFLFLTGAALAATVNDLAPDFDNAITDDGFWDTTGHAYVSVVEASSATAATAGVESRVTASSGGVLALLDSREKTAYRSPALPIFYSTKTGLVIVVR